MAPESLKPNAPALTLRFEAWLVLLTIVSAWAIAHERAMVSLALALCLLLALSAQLSIRQWQKLKQVRLHPAKPLGTLRLQHPQALRLEFSTTTRPFKLLDLEHSGECLCVCDQHTQTVHLTPLRPGEFTLLSALIEQPAGFGFFAIKAWVPLQVSTRISPLSPPNSLALLQSEHHQRAQPRPGDGHELHELRDHVASDPLRRVAWLASAKRRRLLVRQPMDEQAVRSLVLLDLSPEMWTGPVGHAPIDLALAKLMGHLTSLPLEAEFAFASFHHSLCEFVPLGPKAAGQALFLKALWASLTHPHHLDLSQADLLTALASILERDFGETNLQALQSALPHSQTRLDPDLAPSAFDIVSTTKGAVIGALARHQLLTPEPYTLERAAWKVGLRLPRHPLALHKRLEGLTQTLKRFPQQDLAPILITEGQLAQAVAQHPRLSRRVMPHHIWVCQPALLALGTEPLEQLLSQLETLKATPVKPKL